MPKFDTRVALFNMDMEKKFGEQDQYIECIQIVSDRNIAISCIF